MGFEFKKSGAAKETETISRPPLHVGRTYQQVAFQGYGIKSPLQLIDITPFPQSTVSEAWTYTYTNTTTLSLSIESYYWVDMIGVGQYFDGNVSISVSVNGTTPYALPSGYFSPANYMYTLDVYGYGLSATLKQTTAYTAAIVPITPDIPVTQSGYFADLNKNTLTSYRAARDAPKY